MSDALKRFRDEAGAMARELGQPRFQVEFAHELDHARKTFFDDPRMRKLRDDALPFLYDDYGFGIEHSKNTALDAAALVLGSTTDLPPERSRRLAFLAQFAGLLHDVAHHEKDHPAGGAELCRDILRNHPLEDDEREMITLAIRGHEGEAANLEYPSPEAEVLAVCLHDAESFRFGPDICAATLWKFTDYLESPLETLPPAFDESMERAEELRGAFLSRLGRAYGPELLDIGIALAPRLKARLEELALREGAS